MTQLERILVYPIKSLDPATPSDATVVDNGALEWDRRYAILDADGEYVNGKREQRIHRLSTSYDLERSTVTIGERGGDDHRTYHLDVDRDALAAWLAEYLGYEVEVVRDDEGGYPDDTAASGPTVITTDTLAAVADWYDDIDVAEMRRRLRANLEIEAGEAFWEDRLYAGADTLVEFEIGAVTLWGHGPCQRCVVPTRDPATGEPTPGFRRTFVDRREQTLPSWADDSRFDHYFRLMVNTTIPADEWGAGVAVGDEVTIGSIVDAP